MIIWGKTPTSYWGICIYKLHRFPAIDGRLRGLGPFIDSQAQCGNCLSRCVGVGATSSNACASHVLVYGTDGGAYYHLCENCWCGRRGARWLLAYGIGGLTSPQKSRRWWRCSISLNFCAWTMNCKDLLAEVSVPLHQEKLCDGTIGLKTMPSLHFFQIQNKISTLISIQANWNTMAHASRLPNNVALLLALQDTQAWRYCW